MPEGGLGGLALHEIMLGGWECRLENYLISKPSVGNVSSKTDGPFWLQVHLCIFVVALRVRQTALPYFEEAQLLIKLVSMLP